MIHKKEDEILLRSLKDVVIRKCTYLNSKKIVIESETYSLIKLFFKGYLEINYELSFIDILSKVNDLNIDSKQKETAAIFLSKLSEGLYSGKKFSQDELHVIITEFQVIVDGLIKEKKEQSLVDKSMEKVVKIPFIKRLFIRKKNVVIEEKLLLKEANPISVRERLIDKIKNIASDKKITESNIPKIGEDSTSSLKKKDLLPVVAPIVAESKTIIEPAKNNVSNQEKVATTEKSTSEWADNIPSKNNINSDMFQKVQNTPASNLVVIKPQSPEVKSFSQPLDFDKKQIDEITKVSKENSSILINLINIEKSIETLNKYIDTTNVAKKKEVLRKLIKIEIIEDRLNKNLDKSAKDKLIEPSDVDINNHIGGEITDENVATKMIEYLSRMKDKKVKLLEILTPPNQEVADNKVKGEHPKPEPNLVKSIIDKDIIEIDESSEHETIFSPYSKKDNSNDNLDYGSVISKTKSFLNSNSK